MKDLGMYMCLLTWPNSTEMPKSFDFPKHGHIRDIQYPLESGGGGVVVLGPFRVSQILPCHVQSLMNKPNKFQYVTKLYV